MTFDHSTTSFSALGTEESEHVPENFDHAHNERQRQDHERISKLAKVAFAGIKEDLICSSLSLFHEYSKSTPFDEIVQSSFSNSSSGNGTVAGKSESADSFKIFVLQIDYIRDFLQGLKLFPVKIVRQLHMCLFRHCSKLFTEVLKELEVNYGDNAHEDSANRRNGFMEHAFMPVIQLVNDCLEVNLAGLTKFAQVTPEETSCDFLSGSLSMSSSLFCDCCVFLIGSRGLSLDKIYYSRALALCRKLAKFNESLMNTSAKNGIQVDSEAKVEIDSLEEQVCASIIPILDSENGRSFVKFWCEFISLSSSTEERQIPKCLNVFVSARKSGNDTGCPPPEVYMIFTGYMEDAWFWNTPCGKSVTPILIRSIQSDLISTDKSRTETKKRAAFILKGITTMYTLKNPLFDPAIPEVATISLNNMNPRSYTKFWSYFFELFEILNETQLHIVQPILAKLDIFHEYSDNDAVCTWLPILLSKVIIHDNRTIVREGLERFLLSGQYLHLHKSNAYRVLAEDFLDKYTMPLLKDHVGWVLSEPQDFVKNVGAFGTFLNQLYSKCDLPHFRGAEKVLSFLTSSGKCMSSHTIFFFVWSVDEAMNKINHSKYFNKSGMAEKVRYCVETTLNLLALLVSNSLTTVSKYFREQLEIRCVNILDKIALYIPTCFGKMQLGSPVFLKLLTFLGSISEKVLYNGINTNTKIANITNVFLQNGDEILIHLAVSGSEMYGFAKNNLSFTSVLGLFRFLVLVLDGSPKIIETYLEKIQIAIQVFSKKCVEDELLHGSVDGISEFYQHYMLVHIPETYEKLWKDLLGRIETITAFSSAEDFMYCVRSLEMLSTVPWTGSLDIKIELDYLKDPIKTFLLRKIFSLGNEDNPSEMEPIKKLHLLNEFHNPENEGHCQVFEDVNEQFFGMMERHVLAEFYRLKFIVYQSVISHCTEVDEMTQLLVLNSVLDTMEKCDPKGAAAGLRLVKEMMKFVVIETNSDTVSIIQRIASLGWSLVFELRKNEAFWQAMEAFVEFICNPIFVKTGDIDKFADLIFEHGEMIWGLPYVFVRRLVTTEFPIAMLEDISLLLVKTALAGAPLPKNHRTSFTLWDYLRHRKELALNDPENFSSDCKARLLACQKFGDIIRDLISKDDEHKHIGFALLKKVAEVVLDKNDEESITRKRYFGGSTTHRLKQRIFQCLLLLQPYFNHEISEIVLNRTLHSLSTDSPQPSVRYLGEWLITLIVEKYPELNSNFFDCLNQCIHNRVGFGAFFATICLHVSKLLPSEEFYDKALQSLTTLTLSQHLTVRIYSQISFQRIYDRAKENKFETVVAKYEPVLIAFKGALAYVSGNCAKLLDNVSQDFYVNLFDSKTHYCPEVIFSLLPRLSGMIKDECILDPEDIQMLISSAYLKTDDTLRELTDIYCENEKSAWHLKTVVADGRELGEERANEKCLRTKPLPKSLEDDEMINYQKKINPWKLLSVTDELDEFKTFNTKKRCVNEDGLIVVASLLENLPNLGGLCRTCEIFGVQKYVVNTLKVVNELQFQNLSVSAQNWVNILEVPVRDLESFLMTYSAKGYSILGIEQANESSSLTNFTFPKKSVLLLGNEKQGVPAELLHLVDNCIEIPQVGIIRSLNVHVTGALCIWQYATQHIL